MKSSASNVYRSSERVSIKPTLMHPEPSNRTAYISFTRVTVSCYSLLTWYINPRIRMSNGQKAGCMNANQFPSHWFRIDNILRLESKHINRIVFAARRNLCLADPTDGCHLSINRKIVEPEFDDFRRKLWLENQKPLTSRWIISVVGHLLNAKLNSPFMAE